MSRIACIVLALLLIVPCMSNAETIDVQIKGVDDGVRTTKQRDYKEAVLFAKREAVERAGVKVKALTTTKNFVIHSDYIELIAEAVLLPGYNVVDVGYQTDGTYAVILIGKVKTSTEQDTDYTITVIGGENGVKIEGNMAFGIDKKFAQTLEDHPNVQVVHLNSLGGRIGPARRLRDLIERYKLSTYTSKECSSACLIPFMAGQDRILKNDARLGFHAYHFQGTSDQIEIKTDKTYYARRGITHQFLEKAFESKKAWYPTVRELIENGVITHTFDGKLFFRPQQ